jgi:hypothetical protein
VRGVERGDTGLARRVELLADEQVAARLLGIGGEAHDVRGWLRGRGRRERQQERDHGRAQRKGHHRRLLYSMR